MAAEKDETRLALALAPPLLEETLAAHYGEAQASVDRQMGVAGAAFQIAGAAVLLAALAGCGFAVASGIVIGRYLSPRPHAPPWTPSVVLLKPLHGLEPGLERDLAAALAQTYPGPLTMRLGLQHPADPALPLASALAAADSRVAVVLDPAEHGGNRKVSNLINLARGIEAEVVVLSDSDIGVDADYVARLVAALAEPGVGIVTCLYRGKAARPGAAARLGAMGVSYGFLPLAAAGVRLGATPGMGSTLALRRETLEAIGGFERVKDVLADDYEIAAAVRALGLKSVVPPFLVTHGCAEATLAELWRHEVRWAKTVRDLDAAGYAGSLITHPLPLALVGWALLVSGGSAWAGLGGLATAAALLARLWLKSRVDAVTGATSGPWWLIPARDILSVAVFAAAHLARRVEWRGARFHVGRGGELTPV